MKAYISKYACEALKEFLINKGYTLKETYCKTVHKSIGCHPDITMCALKTKIFYGDPSKLSPIYPGDIRYNAAYTERYFIHNLKYTDHKLLQEAMREEAVFIDVKQGYAKCNITVVNETSIITSDDGIANICKDFMDVLKIEKGHILLPGFNYGFIGGCSGKINNTVFFNGDLSVHPDFHKIKAFIEDRNMKCLWFPEYPLTDIGSVITEPEI